MSVTTDRSEAALFKQEQLPDQPDGKRVKLAAQRIEAGEQRRVAAHLAHALDNGLLQLQFQPRIALGSGMIVGAEARLGMPHRRRGVISLDDMIKSLWSNPLSGRSAVARSRADTLLTSRRVTAEGSSLDTATMTASGSFATPSPGSAVARFGLIERINGFLLREACATAMGWSVDWTIALNVGAHHAGTMPFAAAVERELAASRLVPQRLELEIAEAELVEGGASLRENLGRLHGLGVGIVLDEFAHVYASLSLLRRMKLVAIKLDRSLTRSLTASPGDRALLRAAVEIGHGLGVKITADGVETREQFDLLCDAGCDHAQGPWFSQTLPQSGGQHLGRCQTA